MSREVLDGVVELCAERGRVALLRRGLPRARARPGRPPAGRVRSLRARAVARLDVEDLRAARPAARLARLPRPRRAAAHRRPQALHDDLLERAERAPQRARAPASRRARRSQPRHRAREPAAPRRVLRAARRRALVGAADGGPDRIPAAARRRRTRRRSASSWSPPRACSCFPAPSTTSRATSASASAGRPCPRRWSGSSASSTHVLNPAEATSQPGRKVSEHPADTPWCRQHDSLEEGRCNG